MESIYFEKLNARDLWVDGSSSLNINAMCDKILEGDLDFLTSGMVSENTKKEIQKFTSLTNIETPKISVKSHPDNSVLDTSFSLPEKYMNMNVQKRVISGFKKRHRNSTMSAGERDKRLYRIADEIERYLEMGLYDVLRCISYIIDRFKESGVIWGPGRGSACCSYILYLLEVHDIDSFSFELDIDEFLR